MLLFHNKIQLDEPRSDLPHNVCKSVEIITKDERLEADPAIEGFLDAVMEVAFDANVNVEAAGKTGSTSALTDNIENLLYLSDSSPCPNGQDHPLIVFVPEHIALLVSLGLAKGYHCVNQVLFVKELL